MRLRLLLPFLLVGISACGSSSVNNSLTSTSKSCSDESLKGSIVVLAASSMAPVFAEAEEQFLVEHPCVTNVSISYGSSATLAAQIVNGSPADVFVSANEKTMNTVSDSGRTVNTTLFARNSGEIMVNTASPRASWSWTGASCDLIRATMRPTKFKRKSSWRKRL